MKSFFHVFPPVIKLTIHKETCKVFCNHIVTYKNGKNVPIVKEQRKTVLNKKISFYGMFRSKESDFVILALNGERNDPEVYLLR